MSGARALLPYALIVLWVIYVFLTVPEAPNRYVGTRWELSYKLFGGKRGYRMMAGVLVISLLIGLTLSIWQG